MRLRVTLLAAGLFAVTLGVAAFVLLRSLEDDLVDDVRSADVAALRAAGRPAAADGVPRACQRAGAGGRRTSCRWRDALASPCSRATAAASSP